MAVRRGRETLLAGVSFTVARGAIHVVVGPNGAGKSTLLAAVLGQTGFDGRIVAQLAGAAAASATCRRASRSTARCR